MRLSRKRERWATERQSARLVGSPLKPSAAAAMRYEREMDRLITQMAKEYEREIAKLYRRISGAALDGAIATMDDNMGSESRILMNWLGEKWATRFRRASRDLVDRLVRQTDRAAGAQLGESLRELSGLTSIRVPKLPGALSERLTAATAENVALIRSIPEQYHYKVAGTLLRSIQDAGWTDTEGVYQTALKEIRQAGISTHKRASLIARLETAKLTSMIQTERMKSVGVRRFTWRHSGGGAEPRQLHKEYDGQVFDLDNPPIVDERTGERGLPGTTFNCRCFMVPVLEFEGGEEAA